MHKTAAFLPVIAALLLLSCNNEAPATATIDTTDRDTINYAVNEDSLRNAQQNTRPPEGVYQAVLPCADCKGLEHTVLFNPDLSYRLEEAKLGAKEKQTTQVNGNWKPAAGTVWLYKDGTVKARYTWQKDTLLYIEPETEKRYVLQKLKSPMDNDTWRAKKEQGVDLFGVGNEPFWNVEIDEQKGIKFHLAEWRQPLQFKSAQPIVSADSAVYTTTNDSTSLRVVVYNTFCSDGMSDYMYNNKVKVQYRGQTYSGCGIRYP